MALAAAEVMAAAAWAAAGLGYAMMRAMSSPLSRSGRTQIGGGMRHNERGSLPRWRHAPEPPLMA